MKTSRWLTLLMFAGCADAPDSVPEVMRRFIVRPVQVAASSDFPDACIAAISDAVGFFAARSVGISLTVADPLTTPALNGVGQAGVIGVMPGELPMTPTRVVHGETRLALTAGDQVLGAEVVLDGCDTRAVAHELGHGLGLAHLDVRFNLMHSELSLGGWELTATQLGWIAD